MVFILNGVVREMHCGAWDKSVHREYVKHMRIIFNILSFLSLIVTCVTHIENVLTHKKNQLKNQTSEFDMLRQQNDLLNKTLHGSGIS